MKFRVVNVCTSRGDNDILSVNTIEAASLDSAIREVNKDIVDYIHKQLEPGDNLEYALQFFDEYNEVKELNCGVVANGEEDICYIVPEDNYWFNYVDKYNGWDKQMWKQ